MADHFIASELSYLVLQKRRGLGELTTPPLNESNRRLYAIPSVVVQREAFAADREVALDQAKGRIVRHGEQ